MKNPKEQLLKFFKITNAVFDAQARIVEALGGLPAISPMHQLHRMALMELEKDDSNMMFIDHLLELMENQAGQNAEL